MNDEQRAMLHTLTTSETFARLAASVQNGPKLESEEELLSMLTYSVVEVLKHMDNDDIGYRTEEAEAHHVALMALVFSVLFGSMEAFAAVSQETTVTTNMQPTWIN